MLVLVCGDRNWTDRAAIVREVQKVAAQHVDSVITIMHGAARGADTIAGQVAKSLGLPVLVFSANWDLYGRAAGPIRNQQMLDQNPDLVLAFHPDIVKSKGTGDMVRRARKKGTPVEVFSE